MDWKQDYCWFGEKFVVLGADVENGLALVDRNDRLS